MSTPVWLALPCSLFCLAAVGLAAAEPDGVVLAAPCSGCHAGRSDNPDGIPTLVGLSAEQILEKLIAYRSGELQGTLMNRLARGYSGSELRQLADALGAPAQ